MGVDLPHDGVLETLLLILVAAQASFCPDVVPVPHRPWLRFRTLCCGRGFVLISSPQVRAYQEKPGVSRKSRNRLLGCLRFGRIASGFHLSIGVRLAFGWRSRGD
jgi:hypothetical protein